MVLYRIPIMILTLAILYIFIVPDEPFLFKLFFKLLPMVMIIFYGFRLMPKKKKMVHWAVMLGLLFSIIGDAVIHWFVIGLTAFFFAHVCYTIGFFSVKTPKLSKMQIILVLPLVLYALIFSFLLLPTLKESGNASLMIPVVAYIMMISLMFIAAICSGNKFASFGAFLFIISDSLLAWNKFVSPVVFADALIMFSYYGAQLLIAISLYSLIETKRTIIW